MLQKSSGPDLIIEMFSALFKNTIIFRSVLKCQYLSLTSGLCTLLFSQEFNH